MTDVDIGVGLDAFGDDARPPLTPTDRIVRRTRAQSLGAAAGYALASTAGVGVAALLSGAGAVVWCASAFVAVVLALEFTTLQPYERSRSLRPAQHLLVIGGTSLLLATVLEWLEPAEVRGAFSVVLVAVCVLGAAVLARTLTRAPRRLLLVGDRAGVGHFIAQWGGRTDIDMRGICLAEPTDEPTTPRDLMAIPVFGTVSSAPAVAVDLGVDEVVVAPGPALSAYDVRRMSWALEDSLIELTVAAEVHGAVPHRIQPRILGRRLLLSVRPGKRSGVARWAKGAIDRVGAAVLILVFSPLLVTLAILVKRGSPGPALFEQTRTGLDGKPFRMYKFRTMVVDAESLLQELLHHNEGSGPLFKMTDDPRVTRMGRILRHSSLDELPQLFNVLRGEMSLIGPRPCLPHEADTYDEWIRHRMRVKPGMTGMWQVSGRSNLSWQDSVRLDIDYVDNWTLRHDFGIAARTARAVLRRDGAH